MGLVLNIQVDYADRTMCDTVGVPLQAFHNADSPQGFVFSSVIHRSFELLKHFPLGIWPRYEQPWGSVVGWRLTNHNSKSLICEKGLQQMAVQYGVDPGHA